MLKPYYETDLPSWTIPIKRLVVFKDTGSRFCRLPYPNHPNGCPNYYKKKTCPPFAPMAGVFFDLSKPLYFVHSEFNLEAHAKRMKDKHPEWSERQCRCVLYWQGTSRKQLRKRVYGATELLRTNATTTCPEGMGVNVYMTARLSGLFLQRIRNLNICRHIALLGTLRIFKNKYWNEERKQLKLF